jgi:hypothetical protein
MPDDLDEYLLDHYGYCDRDQPKRNDCYWGKDERGNNNGCLMVGWKGRNCPHWHPASKQQIDLIKKSYFK